MLGCSSAHFSAALFCSILERSGQCKCWPRITPVLGTFRGEFFCVGCPVSNVSTQLELQMCIQEPRIGTASCSSTPRIKVNIVLGGTLFHWGECSFYMMIPSQISLALNVIVLHRLEVDLQSCITGSLLVSPDVSSPGWKCKLCANEECKERGDKGSPFEISVTSIWALPK